MAITTPRAIFACAIPTIIVLLSFIWFKRKKALEEKSAESSSSLDIGCSSSDISKTIVSKNCSEQKVLENHSNSAEIGSSPKASEEAEFEISSIEVTQKELPKLRHGLVAFSQSPTIMVNETTSSAEKDDVPEHEKNTEVAGKNNECSGYDLTTENGGSSSDEMSSSSANTDHIGVLSSAKHAECNNSTQQKYSKPLSPIPADASAFFKESTPDKRQVEADVSKKDADGEIGTEVSVKQSSETVTNVTTASALIDSQGYRNDESVEIVDDDDCVILSEVLTEQLVISDRESTEINDSFTEAQSPRTPEIETIVISSDDSKEQTILIESSDDEILTKTTQKSEEQIDSNHCTTDCGELECGASAAAPETTEDEVKDDMPPIVSSPGLSADEPELQKLGNGNGTSAYDSTSHSPDDDPLESPTSNYSDMHSEGSSDSGKGGSDIHTPNADGSTSNFPLTPLQVYEFELPQALCGRLIGRRGAYVNLIKEKSRANISIKKHPFNTDLKLCAVIGLEEDIKAALDLIRKRFPLSKFPYVNMFPVNAPLQNGIPVPDTLQLHLPDGGVTCDVILSSLVTAGHFFVQQPTHPTYSSLSRLDQFMLSCYMSGLGAPELPKPVEPGIICAASMMGGWYRAQIVYVYPDSDECEIKFVDYGGYSRESVSSLRQIRSDFMTLPFQAAECFLANVAPLDETQGWTLEATSAFEELAQGQILQAQIAAYSEDGIPYVHLYRVQGVMSTFINKELVNCSLARWVEHQA